VAFIDQINSFDINISQNEGTFIFILIQIFIASTTCSFNFFMTAFDNEFIFVEGVL
jgi:hypothetical protein